LLSDWVKFRAKYIAFCWFQLSSFVKEMFGDSRFYALKMEEVRALDKNMV